jgi:exopolysaccharide biosynthesis polyprenyl glycosylphosphotransferase
MSGKSPVSRNLASAGFHFLVDGGLVVLCMVFGASWRFDDWLPPKFFNYLPAVLIAAVALPSVLYVGGLYSQMPVRIDRWARFRWFLFGLIVALAVLLSVGSINFDARVGRGVLGVGFMLLTGSMALHQLYLHRSFSVAKIRVACLVSSEDDELVAAILAKSSQQTEVLGVLPVDGYVPSGALPDLREGKVELEEALPDGVSAILVRDRHLVMASLSPMLRRWRYQGVEVISLADVCEMVFQVVPLQLVSESWLFRASSQSGLLYIKKLKRLFDISVSISCLILALPILLVGMATVKLASPGPVFFRQTRLGRMGKPFTILKLRTMRVDAEKDGPQWSAQRDERVFAAGVWLRRFRIDEIPQLFNIFKGEMSFVGPRPERPEFVEMLTTEVPHYRERFLIQPGLTGWAQVRYPYGASVQDSWRKHEHDLFYLKHMSLLLDFFILLETVRTVLIGGVKHSSSHRESMREWSALNHLADKQHPLAPEEALIQS